MLLDRRMAIGGSVARQSGVYDDDPARIRRRRRTRGTVLRAGELVPRRGRPDAIRRLDLRGAEPGATDVSAEHFAGRPGAGVEVVRPGAANASGKMVGSARAPAGRRHLEGR